MYRFINRVDEIKKVFTHFRVIEAALDSIIILLIAFLISAYLELKPGWALFLPSLIYFLIALKYKISMNIIKLIEERYPALKERLSTIYDNREEKNVVVEDLASAVLIDMEKVKYSSFIATKHLGIRVALILLLITLVLYTAITSPPINELKNTLTAESLSTESKTDTSNDANSDIFTEPSYVRIGGDAQGLMVYRGSGGELNTPGEGKQVSEYSQLFPSEASSSDTYMEEIPVIYQQIVKNYFANISRSE